MAHTLAANERGIYEVPITAGEVATINVEQAKQQIDNGLRLIVHSAPSPVYIREGSQVALRDPAADVIADGMYAQIREFGTYNGDTGSTLTYSIISADDAVVSVART